MMQTRAKTETSPIKSFDEALARVYRATFLGGYQFTDAFHASIDKSKETLFVASGDEKNYGVGYALTSELSLIGRSNQHSNVTILLLAVPPSDPEMSAPTMGFAINAVPPYELAEKLQCASPRELMDIIPYGEFIRAEFAGRARSVKTSKTPDVQEIMRSSVSDAWRYVRSMPAIRDVSKHIQTSLDKQFDRDYNHRRLR